MTAHQSATPARANLPRIVFAAVVAAISIHIGMAAADIGLSPFGIALASVAIVSLIVVPWAPSLALCTFVLTAYGLFRYGRNFDDVLTLNLPNWVAFLGFGGWVVWLIQVREKPRLDNWLTLAMVTFVLWVGVTVTASWARGEAFDYYMWHHPAQYLQGVALFLIAAQTLRDRRFAWSFALLLCALPALQVLQRLDRGVYLDNDLPLLSAMLLPLAAMGALSAPHWALRTAFGLLGLNILRVIVMAHNRAAVVGLAFGVLALWWNSRHRLRWALAGAPAVLLAAWLLMPKDYVQRFSVLWNPQASHQTARLDRATIQGRLRLWDGAVRMLADHPIVGVGAGNFSRATEDYLPRKTRLPAHNSILNVAAEMGVPGAVLYLALFLGAVVSLQRAVRNLHSHWPEPFARGVQAALVAYLAGGLFMSRQDMQLAYLLLGWAAALHLLAGGREAATPIPAGSPLKPG